MVKSYPATFIYFTVITLSVAVILSSSNWFFTWMGFELSLFGFLPLFSMNSTTTEAIMKYFLMQASGSAMFLMSFSIKTSGSVILTSLGILMKLGMFPFFQWMPIVMMSLTWYGIMVLTTLQKVMPMLVMYTFTNMKLIIIMSTMSILVSSTLGFNQTMMRPLMAYSSISHTSWISMTTFFYFKMSILYMSVYFTLILLLFKSFMFSGVEKINSLSYKNKWIVTQSVCMLILTGIPPFSIFIFKIYIIILMSKSLLVVSILIISTYISTYYYLSFVIPNLMFSKMKTYFWMTYSLLLNILPLFLIM